MLTPILNELSFNLRVKTKSPLIIRDGRLASEINGQEEHKRDHFFISRTPQDKVREEFANQELDMNDFDFYMPGTSLRGVMRQQAETIMRKLSGDGHYAFCCDPFKVPNDNPTAIDAVSCGVRIAKHADDTSEKPSAAEIFNASCAVCRLFGSTAMASRIEVADGDSVGVPGCEERQHVSIDCFTGGQRDGHLFEDFYLIDAEFRPEVRIRNFEIWQLGLLAYILRDLEGGHVQIGGGKSKGYGRCTVEVEDLRIKYLSPSAEDRLLGIADLASADLGEMFDLKRGRLEENLTLESQENESLVYRCFTVHEMGSGIGYNEFWKVCAQVFSKIANNTGGDPRDRFLTVAELPEPSDGQTAALGASNEEKES